MSSKEREPVDSICHASGISRFLSDKHSNIEYTTSVVYIYEIRFDKLILLQMKK